MPDDGQGMLLACPQDEEDERETTVAGEHGRRRVWVVAGQTTEPQLAERRRHPSGGPIRFVLAKTEVVSGRRHGSREFR